MQAALPEHLRTPPAPPPETDGQRRDRHLALTRELTELALIAARDAKHRIVARDAKHRIVARDAKHSIVARDAKHRNAARTPGEPAEPGDNPTLDLARATRAAIQVVNLENRVAAGQLAPAPADQRDERHAHALRTLLYPLVAGEPDPARRRALKLRLTDGIDDALGIDFDDNIPLADLAAAIARRNGLVLDLAKVHDQYLAAPYQPAPTRGPNPTRPAPTHPANANPAPYRPEATARDNR